MLLYRCCYFYTNLMAVYERKKFHCFILFSLLYDYIPSLCSSREANNIVGWTGWYEKKRFYKNKFTSSENNNNNKKASVPQNFFSLIWKLNGLWHNYRGRDVRDIFILITTLYYFNNHFRGRLLKLTSLNFALCSGCNNNQQKKKNENPQIHVSRAN